MILNKTKNAFRNIFFGSLLKVYQILFPFVLRTIMIYTLGVKYLGLNSLFTSVLQILNLAELGVGNAMVFSMYKPIVQEDKSKICALMKLYKLYYRCIGSVILVIGVAFIPFIPMLIQDEVPKNINVQVLYLLNLGSTVLSYWLFSYKNSILQAHQRQDIISKVTLITDTCKYIMQIIALVIFENYYLYVLSILISQTLINITVAIIAHVMYPEYRAKGTLQSHEKKAINRRVSDLFTARLGGTIVSSADTIVISFFCGLTTLAIYQNYYYVLGSVMAFISIINNSLVAGIGNSMLTKSIEKNYEDFELYVFLQFWIICFCICCFSVLFQPFMEIWVGKKLMFDYPMVILLCLYFLGYELEKMFSVFKDAGGIWHEDRYRPFIYGVMNLLVNIILVEYWGVYGVVLSTILTVFLISIPWIIHNVFKFIFKRSARNFIKKLILYTLSIVIATIIVNLICYFISGSFWVTFIVKGSICFLVTNIIFIIFFHRTPMFIRAKRMICKVGKRD